jgi:two-component system, NtrC family, nitrogen regulation sensor histidine kinase NtrY
MKSLEFRIVLRVLLLLPSLSGLAYLVVNQELVLYMLPAGSIAGLQVYELLRFINKSNQELAQFVLSVRYRDFSQHFNEKKETSVKELRRAFNEINRAFKEINFERESQQQYLRNILELVNTGILSFDTQGEIRWMNESLKKLLGIPYLRNLHSLQSRDENLYQAIIALKAGESRLVEIREHKKVLLSATAFRIEADVFTIVAFQQVNQALDETETLAWQKLLRVLNHEIMNSIAPIASLADTLQKSLEISTQNVDNELIDDWKTGIQVIKNRSENLLHFAETYRHFNRVSQPNLAPVYVRTLFENLEVLFEKSLAERNIELEVFLKNPGLQVEADLPLIEQVLLNLLHNAMEALQKQPQPVIKLSGYTIENQRIVIEISDNGEGIPAEMLDKIFIPFFTTKKSGSGVGLSLSKQIMQLHKGSLSVKSVEGQGSVFILQF